MDILYVLLIGVAAGWLGGQMTKGKGFGLLGNLIVGILGALVGGFLLPLVGLGPTDSWACSSSPRSALSSFSCCSGSPSRGAGRGRASAGRRIGGPRAWAPTLAW